MVSHEEDHRGDAGRGDPARHRLLVHLVRRPRHPGERAHAGLLRFENAFPLADLWLGLACLFALVTLRRRQPAAQFWLVCAGAAGLYLFGMDFLYDVQHGIFTSGAGGAIEAGIVAVTLVFSVTVLRFAWTRRDALIAGYQT